MNSDLVSKDGNLWYRFSIECCDRFACVSVSLGVPI